VQTTVDLNTASGHGIADSLMNPSFAAACDDSLVVTDYAFKRSQQLGVLL
jgi:hypothetical protein